MSIRDLWSYSGRIRNVVTNDTVTLTLNGKPFALMIGLGEEDDPAELDGLVRQARASAAVSAIHKRAGEAGIDRMSANKIEEEIQAARSER